jgi:hypothetical protein
MNKIPQNKNESLEALARVNKNSNDVEPKHR